MKKLKFLLASIVVATFAFYSCESYDLNGTQDPDALPLGVSEPNFKLNSIQTSFVSFYYSISADTKGPIRMINQFGSYNSAADPQNTQGQWTSGYANVLKEIKNFKETENQATLPYHFAIAKIIESYTMVSLVDFFGDVPYTQALLGAGNLNPGVDSGASIYDAMIVNLDESIALLNGPVPVIRPNSDLFYNGIASKWVKLANSLKLKMYNNLRLTRDVSAPVNAILLSGDFMSSNADDFNFKYNTTSSPVDSRHPDYTANYDGSPDFYLSNSYIKLMLQDKSVQDPRIRYYFYRQSSAAPSGQNLPCATNANIPICYITGSLYWGRDHADNSGLPADGPRRSVVGLYPAGGRFDSNNYQAANTGTAPNNAQGAGVLNILDYSFVQFMIAELALTEPGVNGNAAALLTSAVTNNISKVMNFNTSVLRANNGTLSTFIPSTSTVNTYISEVNSNFAAATDTQAKLNVLIKEFFVASWGNGMEAYNMYRRTGMPLRNAGNLGIQSPVTAAGEFIRSFPYPSNAILNNDSLDQKMITSQVFWDNNPSGASFID